MKLNYPNLRREHNSYVYDYRGTTVKIYGAKLVENITQALCRVIMTTAENYLYHKGYMAALSVHDELIYVIKESRATKFAEVISKVMSLPVLWLPTMPVAVEVSVGNNYLEAK